MPLRSILFRGPSGLLCLLVAGVITHAKEQAGIQLNTRMKQAAVAFLDTLGEPQRTQATFGFEDPERTDWHYVPKDRPGVSLREMNLTQRRAARALMRSALSEKGYFKSLTIMSLELVLRQIEAGREDVDEIRNPEKYWFAVFGDPASDTSWGWRVEGHHLSLNFTSVGGVVTGTAPLFLGANPAEVRDGPRAGMRVLGNEIDQARELMAAFTAEQRERAIISPAAPRDVLTLPGQPVEIGEPVGVAAAEMTPPQRELLEGMLVSFLNHLRPTLAKQEIHAIGEEGFDAVHFAWAGSLDPKKKHYFRLHGPGFVLEYDDAQGNHAHLVWHSRGNDFGASALHRHYRESPHHGGDRQ